MAGRGLDEDRSGSILPKGQYGSAQRPHVLWRARYSKQRSSLEWQDPTGTNSSLPHSQDICLALGWCEPRKSLVKCAQRAGQFG